MILIVISVTNLAKTSMMADKSLADQNSMMNVGRWVVMMIMMIMMMMIMMMAARRVRQWMMWRSSSRMHCSSRCDP